MAEIGKVVEDVVLEPLHHTASAARDQAELLGAGGVAHLGENPVQVGDLGLRSQKLAVVADHRP